VEEFVYLLDLFFFFFTKLQFVFLYETSLLVNIFNQVPEEGCCQRDVNKESAVWEGLFVFWCLMPISTIFRFFSWRSVLLMEETGVPGENHRPVTSNWQTLSHNVVSSTPRLGGIRIDNGKVKLWCKNCYYIDNSYFLFSLIFFYMLINNWYVNKSRYVML
jgi:hypothetical protein